jgi:2-iminobutanoate/2-iminopropanoate deaminase
VHELGNVAFIGGNFTHQCGRDVGEMFRRSEKQGFYFRSEHPVHADKLKLILKIRHGAQAAQNKFGIHFPHEIREQAGEAAHVHVADMSKHLATQFNTHFERHLAGFLRAGTNGNNNPVENAGSSLDEVRVAVGNGIEGAWIDYGLHREVSGERSADYTPCHHDASYNREGTVNGIWYVERWFRGGEQPLQILAIKGNVMRKALISKNLPKPAFKYSHLTQVGAHYYMSGLLAQDRQSGALAGETAGEQAARILENVQVLMTEFSLGFEHLAMARIFTTQMDKFSEINAAWEKVFNHINEAPPARTSIGVAALPLGAMVEIEFTFYKE